MRLDPLQGETVELRPDRPGAGFLIRRCQISGISLGGIFDHHRDSYIHERHLRRAAPWLTRAISCLERTPERRRGASGSGEAAGGEEQHAPIFGRRGAVQAHQCQFITNE
jgi:hypothetical protein